MVRSTSQINERKTGRSSFGRREILSQNPWSMAGLWALGLAGVGLSLVLPNQVGRLTEIFGRVQRVTWQPVIWAVAFMVAAQVGLSLIRFLRTRIEVSLRESVSRALTLTLFGRILRFGADFFRDQEVERINSRALDDTNRVTGFRVSAMVGLPLAAVSIVVFGTIMLLDNYFLGLCMVILSVLSGYLVVFDRQIQAANRQARQTWDGIRVSANEVIGGVSEFRNHYAFDYGMKGLSKSFDNYQGVMVRVGRLMAVFGAIDPLIVTIQTGVLFWVGAALCIPGSPLAAFAGQMTWGGVIKFMLLAQLFQGPVAQIAGYILQWRMAKESVRRVDEYMKRPCVFERSAGAAGEAPDRFDVAYRRVSVVTPSGMSIIKDVDLAIGSGQHAALCGPSGCGKSTMLQMLVRGVEPSSGRLTLGGRALEEHDLLLLARQIGFVPQSPILLNTSIRNNLLLGLRRHAEGCVADDEGPIDVARLADVRDLDDVDRELISVVKLVGLTDDIVRKFLDGRLTDAPAAKRFRDRIGELRGRVAPLANESAPDTVIPFDRRRWIPGTVGENLLGPGFAAADAAGRVFRILQGDPLLGELMLLGCRRFCSEHALAVRVSHDRPGLLALLPGRGGLGEREALPATCRAEDLAGLPHNLQESLLGIALDTEAELARELADSDSFASRIIEARSKHFARAGEAACPWDMAGSTRYLDALSVRENLLCGRADARLHGAAERLDQVIQQVLVANGLDTDAILLGLEFRVGEGGKLLSGGQQQKVAIARAVLKRPSLLVLDEATAGLDEVSQSRVVEMVREHFRGRTVVSVSHRLSSIRGHDRIVVLDRGQVVQQGTYDGLAEQEGIFRDLVRQETALPLEAEAPRRIEEPAESAAAGGDDRLELRRRIAMTGIFSQLRSDQLAFIESVMKVIRCPKDDVLFRRGDPGQELFVILEGAVDFFVERPSGGRVETVVVNSAGPGGIFGELAMFGRGLRTVGARARTDASLGVLGREDLIKLIHADPSISINLLEAVSGHLARTCDAAYRDHQGN